MSGHCTAQHCTEGHGKARHSTALHSTARHGRARQGTARHGTVRHSTARHCRAVTLAHCYACIAVSGASQSNIIGSKQSFLSLRKHIYSDSLIQKVMSVLVSYQQSMGKVTECVMTGNWNVIKINMKNNSEIQVLKILSILNSRFWIKSTALMVLLLPTPKSMRSTLIFPRCDLERRYPGLSKSEFIF